MPLSELAPQTIRALDLERMVTEACFRDRMILIIHGGLLELLGIDLVIVI